MKTKHHKTKVHLPNESATPRISAFSLNVKENVTVKRRIAEKPISDILFEIEMSADMSADGELNR